MTYEPKFDSWAAMFTPWQKFTEGAEEYREARLTDIDTAQTLEVNGRVELIDWSRRCGTNPATAGNLFIVGASVNGGSSIGAGKTRAAHAVLHDPVSTGRWKAQWFSAWRFGEAMSRDVAELGRFLEPDILMLDDLGNGAVDVRPEWLWSLLDARKTSMRPTVVTTNLGPTEIVAQYGGDSFDRLWQGATIVAFVGPSRRTSRSGR